MPRGLRKQRKWRPSVILDRRIARYYVKLTKVHPKSALIAGEKGSLTQAL